MGDDVATYLAANTSLNQGKDMFVGNMPKSRNNCVGIFDTGGGPPRQDYPVNELSVQIDVRKKASSYTAAMTLAQTIFKLLNRKDNLTIGTKDVMMVKAINDPQVVGLDDNNRWIVTMNFTFIVRDPYAEEA